MCNNRRVKSLVLALALVAAGCSTPRHTNTLIFATSTKLALDVSADPSGNPSVTVGYRRQEGVWMPLLANKDDRGNAMQDAKFMYVGTNGGNGEDYNDAYSVLASFGATFKGESALGMKEGGGKASTGGSIAQFFATGLAARSLAEKGGSKVVSVQADDGIPEDIKKKAKEILADRYHKIDLICAHAQQDGKVDHARLSPCLQNTGLEKDTFFQKLGGKDVGQLRIALRGPYLNLVDPIYGNCLQPEGGGK